MIDSRPLTDEELEQLLSGALNQLSVSVREYNESKGLLATGGLTQQIAVDRFNAAKESVRISLHVYHGLRDDIERRYRNGNPV